MVGEDCPKDVELLAWLQDPFGSERCQPIAAHIDACSACQTTLAQLDAALEEDPGRAADDDLLADLRRPEPADELEREPECSVACTLAETAAISRSVPAGVSRQPDASDVLAITQQGRYEILGVLGHGGMGVVYKARNLKMNRLVAIKVLPPLKPQDPGAAARFEREIQTLAQLKHPHIVTAYDADEADGKHFLVMEYIDGSDLKTVVQTQGPLPVLRAVQIILQAAQGLQYAHEQGIVHRDIKPANLMLEQNGSVKVLDLGLARIESNAANQADLTVTGMMMGTVDYLAPEQAASARNIDGRADIYSLGCSLYYLLTGAPLYDGDTVIQKVLAHREEPIPALGEARPDCPALLEQVFARMVAKRPDDRYPKMADVIADLERILASPESFTPQPSGVPTEAAVSPMSRGGWRRILGKRRVMLAVVAVVSVAACAALIPPLVKRLGSRAGSEVSREKKDSPPGSKGAAPGKDSPGALASGAHAGEEWDSDALHMKFCWCPPGKFLMGSPKNEAGRAEFESPQVEVELTQGYWLGKFEVTQDEWQQMMGTKPSRFHGAKTLPVENISWKEASKFCELLTQQERARGSIPAGWEFRLPTEAQWEYACRAGTTTAYSFGPSTEGLGDYMWYSYNSQIHTNEVGRKQPNAWGFHDMHGNVWEWCRDWFQNKLPGGVDPLVTEVGTGRVFRGGGWESAAHLCRTAFRSGQVPDEAGHVLGFRVALVEVSTAGRDAPTQPPPEERGHP